MAAADDSDVWAYARQYGFIIVSKDGDFSGRSSLYGAPPKVIWLALGNCSTSEIDVKPMLRYPASAHDRKGLVARLFDWEVAPVERAPLVPAVKIG